MEETFRIQLRRIYRVNRVLYFAVLMGMVTLTLVAVLFYFGRLLPSRALVDIHSLDKVLLMLVLFLLLLVFYLKRTYLQPEKLIKRAEKKELNITAPDVTDFIQEFGIQAGILAKTLIIMRRYFMVVWSIANLALLLAFIGFILTSNFRLFLIYAVVGFYSIFINFPSFRLVERCFYLTEAKKES